MLPEVLSVPLPTYIPGCASRRRAASSTKSAPSRPSATRLRKGASSSGSISAITWTRDCFSTTASFARRCATGPRMRIFSICFAIRQRHGLRRRRRRALERERRSVEHLSRLGARQFVAEWLRRSRPRARARGLSAMAGGPGGVREPRFDLMFVDPPTFSNSKRMDDVLDVQRDHVGMIRRSMKLLRPAGRLVFSTQFSRFKLDSEALEDLCVEDISARTIPKDFERNARIHRCFIIQFREQAGPERDSQVLVEARALVARSRSVSCRCSCSWADNCCRGMWGAPSWGRSRTHEPSLSSTIKPGSIGRWRYSIGIGSHTSCPAIWANPSPFARRWRRSSPRH